MPYEASQEPLRRVAVIGGGISGMGAAYHLARSCRVTLFESEKRLGGHARTVLAGRNGDQPVDTGFIVFNHANYPYLSALFHELGVPIAPSKMTFGVSIDGGRFEYALNSLNSLFAQRRNVANPFFLRMLRDLVVFNRAAREAELDETLTIAEFLDQVGCATWFRDYYLMPFSGAIWSTPTRDILDFPAAALIRFFRNHALLDTSGQHQWHTVRGGSTQYVRRLATAMDRCGVEIREGAPVDSVRRLPGFAQVKTRGAEWEQFDEVIFATHSDDTLRLLDDPSPFERQNLSAIRYQPNQAVLHADTSVMPRRKLVWSSWNYSEASGRKSEDIDLTYWMNSLQPIPESDPMFVTLNSARPIREELIYDTATFQHPVYNHAAFAAQKQLARMNGTNSTWFCGAWMKNGFHEDGLASAVDVVEAIEMQTVRMAA